MTEIEGQKVAVPDKGQWWMKTGNFAVEGDNEMQYADQVSAAIATHSIVFSWERPMQAPNLRHASKSRRSSMLSCHSCNYYNYAWFEAAAH